MHMILSLFDREEIIHPFMCASITISEVSDLYYMTIHPNSDVNVNAYSISQLDWLKVTKTKLLRRIRSRND